MWLHRVNSSKRVFYEAELVPQTGRVMLVSDVKDDSLFAKIVDLWRSNGRQLDQPYPKGIEFTVDSNPERH